MAAFFPMLCDEAHIAESVRKGLRRAEDEIPCPSLLDSILSACRFPL